MSAKKPGIAFDFDGTLVDIAEKRWSRQNAYKYPMARRELATDLLEATSERGDVDNLGIITMRKAWLRRRATERVLVEAELDVHFRPDQVHYAGNDRKKALHLGATAVERGSVVAILDDRPHKVGFEAVKAIAQGRMPEFGRLIVIAAEADSLSHPSIGRFADRLSEVAAVQDGRMHRRFDFGAEEYEVGTDAGVVTIIPALGPSADEVIDHVISLGEEAA